MTLTFGTKMSKLIAIITLVAVLIGLGVFFTVKQTRIANIPQSERCRAICDHRDLGSLENLNGKSREEVRAILGDPQNIDTEGEVWVWLFQWDSYKTRGLARDWKTMAANSSGSGLWIRFESDRCVTDFPYSFTAADPLDPVERESVGAQKPNKMVDRRATAHKVGERFLASSEMFWYSTFIGVRVARRHA